MGGRVALLSVSLEPNGPWNWSGTHAQQVCAALAGSPEEALLWFEGQALANTRTHRVLSAVRMLMVGFITAGHFLSVRSFKEAHITQTWFPSHSSLI